MPFIGKQSSGHSKIKKSRFTATASQTAFSVVSAAGDELQVFLNGVLLKETDDYTYTTSTVTLGTGASVNDIVEVHVYQSFTIADTVDIAGDTMTGELEVPTVKLSSNIIKASDGGSTITLDDSDNVTIGGDLKVTNLKHASSSSNNLVLGSDGSATINQISSSSVFPAGHPILLSSSESTSAVTSVEFDNTIITSTYKHYILRIHKIIPATDAVNLYLAFSTDNGSSFRNVGTARLYSRVAGSGSGHEFEAETNNGLYLGGNSLGNDALHGQSAEFCIFGSQDTNYNYFDVKGFLSGKHITNHYTWWTSGYVNHAQTAINFLKLSFSSGNIAKHNLNLYGIK